MNKKALRLRRSLKTRQRMSTLGKSRLSVYRSNSNIYASLIDANSDVLVTVSTLQKDVLEQLGDIKPHTVKGAALVGTLIAKKAQDLNVSDVVFDRSGYHYHGKIKALAEAAREGGLKF